MTLIKLIKTDFNFIRSYPFNQCHPCSIFAKMCEDLNNKILY